MEVTACRLQKEEIMINGHQKEAVKACFTGHAQVYVVFQCTYSHKHDIPK